MLQHRPVLLGTQLNQLLEKQPERRQVRKQSLERIVVHRQDVDSGHSANGRGPWHLPNQSHLSEAFARPEPPEHHITLTCNISRYLDLAVNDHV